MKRSAALFALAVVLLVSGCSSTRSAGDQASSSTMTPQTTAVPADSADDPSATLDPLSPPGTVQIDDSPVVNNPDAAKFCAAFFTVQTVSDSLSGVNFVDNGLQILAAPKQFAAAARSLRESAPSDLAGASNAYADRVNHAAEAVAAAQSLRQLEAAMVDLTSGYTDPNASPVFDFVKSSCTDPNASPAAGQ